MARIFSKKIDAQKANPMEKKIIVIRRKMIAVITAVLALAAWSHHFVMEGIATHPEVTLTILTTAAFGTVLAFIFIAKLKNDIVAFEALREMWDDIRRSPEAIERDPFVRHARCAVPAQVFHRPRLLGHAYELVTGELARTKNIRVSVETMNTLVGTIDEAINDEKSLIVYISGLLVFMGLIGTFIGLLHMVGSIGGVIGSLAASGDGGDTSGAFQKLLGSLQEPLKGMAAGFAASLFGLFTSLVVGLLGRFAGQAAGVLKGEFEAWLAGVVQIGEDEQAKNRGAEPHEVGMAPAAHADPAMINMVGNVLSDYTRVASMFDQVSRKLTDLNARQDKQSEHFTNLTDEIGQMRQTQAALVERMGSTAAIAPALAEFGERIEAFGTKISRQFEVDSAGMRDILSEMSRNQANGLRVISSSQLQTATQISTAMDQISAELERRAIQPSSAGLEAALERSLSLGLSEIGRAITAQNGRIEERTSHMIDGQTAMMHALHHMAERPQPSSQLASGVAERMEIAVSDGMNRVSQSMETAFAAYSGLLHLALAAMERSGRAQTEDTAANAESKPNKDEIDLLLSEFQKRAGGGSANTP